MSRKFLYRRLGSAVIVNLMLVAVAVGPSEAQERPQLKRPQETPEEKPAETKKTKKVKGPRAVGVLQLSNGKATLIPVAILVDGKFHDASVYKADPVPMALETGTVYEAEQAGESQGLFTANGALHSKAAGSVNPWVGTGSYLPHGTEAPKTTRKAEDVPVGLDNSGDEPPRLTRKSGSASNSNPASNSSSPPASAPQSSEKPDGTATPANGSSASGSSGGDAPKGASPASDKTAAQGDKKPSPPIPASGASSSGQATQGQSGQGGESENYYRPTLRRGKPTEAAPKEDVSAAKVENPGSPASSTPVIGTQFVQLMPAISDSGGPDPQSYKFFWKEGEEEERHKQMLALAGDELRAYIAARAKGTIAAQAPTRKAEAPTHKGGLKPVPPVYENIQFRAFDVWKNNQPVMILSAEAQIPAAPGTATVPETYNITLVSRTDIYGSLRKLYSGVTDKFHLDVTPRLALIDAVDADGDGRGELLFRETTDAGNGYIIYRPTGDKLWKMFDSLGGG
jgi:hypothetical protein